MSGGRRVGLSKEGARPLLSMVRDRPHATQEHHEDLIPERYTGGPWGEKQRELEDEDINRDPASDSDSSDDDKENSHDDPLALPRKAAPHRIRAPRANIHGTHAGPSTSKTQSMKKPTSGDAGPKEEDSGDGFVMASSSQGKRKTTQTYAKRDRKKLAQEKATEAAKVPKASKVTATFRHPAAMERLAAIKAPSRTLPSLRKPNMGGNEEHPVPPSSQSSSVKFIDRSAFTPPTSTDTSTGLKPARTAASNASSPLTEISSSDDDDDSRYKLPKTVDQEKAEKSCPLCGEQVDVIFKRDFLIEKCKGKRMNVRLQELFCKAHKERTAKKQWRDREYPEINWMALPRRLKKHGQRIQDVLDGKIHSAYRDELEGRLRSGKTKSAMQVWVNETDTLVRVGYYGSRGEKAMTDYIVKAFGEELRQRAGTDHVINAMGVTGGVSGYLQSVLIPEMALALVMEDADCDAEEARRIIKESSDIGDALNEVEQEKVPRSTAMVNLIDSEDEDEEDYHENSLLLND